MMNDLLTQSDNDLLSAPATDQDMLQLSAALANLDTGNLVIICLPFFQFFSFILTVLIFRIINFTLLDYFSLFLIFKACTVYQMKITLLYLRCRNNTREAISLVILTS